MPSGVRVWEVLSVVDGGHGRFTQRALLHRTPRMRRVNGRCGLGVANETAATQPHTLLFLRSAPRVAWYCRGDRVGYVLLLGRGAAFAPSRPRHGCGALLRWGGGRRGGRRRAARRLGRGEGARGNTCPRTLRFSCRLRAHCESRDAICRWARVATRLRVGTHLPIGARHGCGSGVGASASPLHCSERPRCVGVCGRCARRTPPRRARHGFGRLEGPVRRSGV